MKVKKWRLVKERGEIGRMLIESGSRGLSPNEHNRLCKEWSKLNAKINQYK